MTYMEIMNNNDQKRSNSDLIVDAKFKDPESDTEKNQFEELTRRYDILK